MPQNTPATTKRPYEKLVQRLGGKAELDSASGEPVDAFEIASQIVDKIETATSEDELFAANDSSLAGLGDYVGQPINITEIVFRKSEEKYAKGGLGAYVVVDFFTDNGDAFKATCGATNVVATLEKAQNLGLITADKPWRCKVNGKETANGTLLKIGRA